MHASKSPRARTFDPSDLELLAVNSHLIETAVGAALVIHLNDTTAHERSLLETYNPQHRQERCPPIGIMVLPVSGEEHARQIAAHMRDRDLADSTIIDLYLRDRDGQFHRAESDLYGKGVDVQPDPKQIWVLEHIDELTYLDPKGRFFPLDDARHFTDEQKAAFTIPVEDDMPIGEWVTLETAMNRD